MSWYVSFSNLTLDELDNLKATDEQLQNGLARNAFEESRDVIVELAQTGIVGSPSKLRFSGHMSGHANDQNEPLPGWTPDFVNLNLSQVRDPSKFDKAANS